MLFWTAPTIFGWTLVLTLGILGTGVSILFVNLKSGYERSLSDACMVAMEPSLPTVALTSYQPGSSVSKTLDVAKNPSEKGIQSLKIPDDKTTMVSGKPRDERFEKEVQIYKSEKARFPASNPEIKFATMKSSQRSRMMKSKPDSRRSNDPEKDVQIRNAQMKSKPDSQRSRGPEKGIQISSTPIKPTPDSRRPRELEKGVQILFKPRQMNLEFHGVNDLQDFRTKFSSRKEGVEKGVQSGTTSDFDASYSSGGVAINTCNQWTF